MVFDMVFDNRPIVVQLGGTITYNTQIYEHLSRECTVIQLSTEERQRDEFLQGLKTARWGNFEAIFRPSMEEGGEMGYWDAELVSFLPKSVKIFASAGAGYDWVDMESLSRRGILYCNGGDSASESVAEMAMFHILSVFRNLNFSTSSARSGDTGLWMSAHKSVPKTAHSLQGKVLGIIGLGNIGLKIARKAYLGFGMRIHYYDTIQKSKEQEASCQATYAPDIGTLLAYADCVVLATPFGGEKMIKAETIAKFKKGARFVNIARGALVDEEALIQAVRSEHLSAIGLDVFEKEPKVSEGLLRLRNATLTCHNAGGTVETFADFERLSMENIVQYLRTGRAITPVNGSMLRDNR